MFNRILVPLDGSTLAERAIPHAEQFARIFQSTIVLLQVLDATSFHENPNPVDPLSWQIRKTEADIYMQGIAAHIRENLKSSTDDTTGSTTKGEYVGKQRVEYSILEGKTAENIVNFAQSENIDLLVISTHGSGGLSRWNISSITQKVIDLVYLPILIVRAYDPPVIENARVYYRNILLPIDSSRRAECSLSAAITLAGGANPKEPASNSIEELSNHDLPDAAPHSTKLILAAVVPPPEIPIPIPYPVEIDRLSSQLMDVSRQAVITYLNEMKSRLPVKCESCLVEGKNVSSAIRDLVIQEEIDLVILCAHGYTGESSWPYGSVARNYMEHGIKPVLIIQDVPRSRVQPTAAEIAAKTSGRR